MIAEPDVALTDWALSVECAAFAWRLRRAPVPARWLGLLFAAVACASLAGGAAHAFAVPAAVWTATLLAIGVAAFAAWRAGASLLEAPRTERWIVGAALLELAAYATFVVAGAETFAVAIANYLVACAFLTAALGRAFVRTGDPGALAAAAAMALTFAGAAMQQARVGCRAASLSHNALFHVVQGVAFAILFLGARRLTRRTP